MCAPRCALVSGLLAAILVAACGDHRFDEPASIVAPEPALGVVPEGCDVSELQKASREYFSNPWQRASDDALKAMEDACSQTQPNQVESHGWAALAEIESALAAGAGGDPETGAWLANDLMRFLCENAYADGCGSYSPVAAGALETGGVFAVREAASNAPVVAHSTVPFVDPGGVQNQAIWGIELGASPGYVPPEEPTWGYAVGTGLSWVLFHGAATGAGGAFDELAIDLFTFEDVPVFFDPQLIHVGVCYEFDFESPLGPGGVVLLDRMRRNGNILTDWEPSFSTWCTDPAAIAQAGSPLRSLFEMFASRVARRLAPALLVPASRRVSSTGGSPIDFSVFAPTAADPSGSLEEVPPNTLPSGGDIRTGDDLGPIEIRALSGDGIPMERVLVTLYVAGNSGVPAGAELSCGFDPTAPGLAKYEFECADGTVSGYTFEDSGSVVFPAELHVGKAGGYRICAMGQLEGDDEFTYSDVCSPLFNVKKAEEG